MIILGSPIKVNSADWLGSTYRFIFFLERYFLESVGYEDSIESLAVLCVWMWQRLFILSDPRHVLCLCSKGCTPSTHSREGEDQLDDRTSHQCAMPKQTIITPTRARNGPSTIMQSIVDIVISYRSETYGSS